MIGVSVEHMRESNRASLMRTRMVMGCVTDCTVGGLAAGGAVWLAYAGQSTFRVAAVGLIGVALIVVAGGARNQGTDPDDKEVKKLHHHVSALEERANSLDHHAVASAKGVSSGQ
jgi:heme O synthase-like polyprenyltransferase